MHDNKEEISRIWKRRNILLIYKGEAEENPGNERWITLTSIIYKIIFLRIFQVIMDQENRSIKKAASSMSQKDFFQESMTWRIYC
jgi:ABC-type uncharacterized transport system fused permease/ATPase subunit